MTTALAPMLLLYTQQLLRSRPDKMFTFLLNTFYMRIRKVRLLSENYNIFVKVRFLLEKTTLRRKIPHPIS
jgi:hypothetical protein